MTPQEIFDTALPFLATLISYGLQQMHYSDRTNTIIASVTILLAGGASVWIGGQITPDILKDAALIMAAATALQANALAPLMDWLKGNFPLKSRKDVYGTQPLVEPSVKRASRETD